jgi:hypothetical protein
VATGTTGLWPPFFHELWIGALGDIGLLLIPA